MAHLLTQHGLGPNCKKHDATLDFISWFLEFDEELWHGDLPGCFLLLLSSRLDDFYCPLTKACLVEVLCNVYFLDDECLY